MSRKSEPVFKRIGGNAAKFVEKGENAVIGKNDAGTVKRIPVTRTRRKKLVKYIPIVLLFLSAALLFFVAVAFFAVTAEPALPPGGVYSDIAEIDLEPPRGSVAYYTLDGSQPTERSPSTDKKITLTLDETTTVHAYAVHKGRMNSETVSETYEVDISPYRPILSLEGGEYHGATFVYATCVAGEEIQIRYTLDGSEPTARSSLFSADRPAILLRSATMKARSFQGETPLNRTITEDFRIADASDSARLDGLPEDGTYEDSVEIPLEQLGQNTCVFYTTDGSEPTTESPVARQGEALIFDRSVELKLLVVREAENPGEVVRFEYKVRNPKPVVKALKEKSSKDKLVIEITPPTPNSVVYYTTDGSKPDEHSKQVKKKKTLNISEATTVKAVTKSGGREDSRLFSKKYDPAKGITKEETSEPNKTNEKKVTSEKDEKNKTVNKNKKVVALTFDDGPGKYTETLLKALKKRGVKATFFLLGMQAEKFPEVVKKMAKDGHELGNHTWAHATITGLSDKDYKETLKKTNDVIEDLTGKRPGLFRPPGGTYDSRKTPEKMTRVLWTLDTKDWRYRNADYVCDYVIEYAKSGDIVLCHDIYESTVNGILRAIDQLQKEGYRFVTYSQLQKEKG